MATANTPAWRRNLRLYLDLSSTQVTDAGLAHLKMMSSLKWLDLRKTAVTDTGLKDLKSALPMLGYNR